MHLVNVWASAHRLLLGQWKVADHSNEITALPELLRALELAGCTVTVDALNCQKNAAKEIREADADYVLALKANHGTLHAEVKEFLDDDGERAWRDVPRQFHETLEKAHGRLDTRRAWITEAIDWLADKAQWENLRSVAVVEATCAVRGQSSTERRFYLTSLPADAERLAGAVRGHWEVENCVHWALDVQLGEDACGLLPSPRGAEPGDTASDHTEHPAPGPNSQSRGARQTESRRLEHPVPPSTPQLLNAIALRRHQARLTTGATAVTGFGVA